MILVFGGTTEGKKVIQLLEKLGLPYIYSTKTEISVALKSHGTYRFGAFSEASLSQFVVENYIDCCIHASHPFATVLHKTIATVFEKHKLPVFRLQREYPEHSTSKNVYYVSDYPAAISLLKNTFSKKILLGLTGVQTIEKLRGFWKTNWSYFRILDRQSSIDIAVKSNFPLKQLILGYPNTRVSEEIALYKAKKVEVVLTKESGNSGSLSIKIDAAANLGIPIIIIKKPSLPPYFQLAANVSVLESLLKPLKL